ncbi:MAG: NGG1p interacting factor NIF3 [Firmicutes bacterium]|nr:NGG1p interacting factor NIF3 [Bacillota bacterium]
MLLKDLYALAIAKGIEADPRGREEVERILKEAKQEYEELSDSAKEEFDREQLTNPYADTRISFGDPELEVNRLITGVDVDTSELLLVNELNRQGRDIDLVIAHHPVGLGRINFKDVMYMQADMMANFGVPINVAEAILAPRAAEVGRAGLPANHYRVVDAARLLNIPVMCMHTPADNNAQLFVQNHLDQAAPRTLDDVVEALKEIPEYKQAAKMGIGPTILVGNGKNRAGRIAVIMTGGTGGPAEDIEALVNAGVGTIVEMHLSEEKRKLAEKHHLNVVIAGHMASDSLGMNLILDEFAKQGVAIETFSGLIRVSRN